MAEVEPGQTFNNWTAIEVVAPNYSRPDWSVWRCRCVCGVVRVRTAHDLVSGRSRSCGCIGRKRKDAARIKKFVKKHGFAPKKRGERLFTYCVVDPAGRAKVGVTSNVSRRFHQLQTDNPDELKLVGYIQGDYEKELHEKFVHLHIRGEWFRATPELLAEFSEASNRINPELIADEQSTYPSTS